MDRYAIHARYVTYARYARYARYTTYARYATDAKYATDARHAPNARCAADARYATDARHAPRTRYATDARYAPHATFARHVTHHTCGQSFHISARFRCTRYSASILLIRLCLLKDPNRDTPLACLDTGSVMSISYMLLSPSMSHVFVLGLAQRERVDSK